ncbi:MAG: hypothetical protein KatS3mg077_1048 [Candidatus Binatia bacterium]|nr:MAG: hypothetical protein KatS3mg077_1048 [Candidatus Binatia bacterium]
MERLRIGVVDRSPSVRETVAIVLREHEVSRFSPEAFASLPEPFRGDVLILEWGAISAEVLGRLAPGVPVLWLHGTNEPAPEPGALPRLFLPHALRKRVREVHDASQASQPREAWVLPGFPSGLLPEGAIETIRGVLRTQLPTIVCGEPGAGKLRLARAIHVASGNRFFHRVSAAAPESGLVELVRSQAEAGPVTVCFESFERVSSAGEQALAQLLDLSSGSSVKVWVVALSRCTLDDLAEKGNVPLLRRLGVFVVTIPPLRQRGEQLSAIIQAEALRLSSVLRVPPATFTPEALERLRHYLWPGNLSELETVLARTMTLVRHRPIAADEILFEAPVASVAVASSANPTPAQATTPDLESQAESTARQLEVLLNELAHELKNPLVTIKTISQHLERLLSDEAGREQVTQLAGEAVDRMDQLLENLLRFARFGAPNIQTTSLNAILAPALADLAPLVAEKQVILHYAPSEHRAIAGDPNQLSFAMTNLLRAVVRDLEEGSTLAIQAVGGGTELDIRFPAPKAALVERLSEYVDWSEPQGRNIEPLGFLIARSLLYRNTASFAEQPEGSMRCITVKFTPAKEMTADYAQATRPSRG